MLIVLEGIDGSGTTTQLARVAAALRARGHRVHETREPSDGPIGRAIRAALRGEERYPSGALALLFAADRLDHLAREIEPALARGELVLCDRYVGSSLVYQSSFVPEAFVRVANARARPADLTLVLDVPAEEAARRRGHRGGDAELFEVDALQAKLAERYRTLPALLPGEDVRVCDGARAPEAVEAELVAIIERRLLPLG